jgi:hypothetical protein
MSEALPRIGWIDNAHGVRQRDTVAPRVSAADLDRLAVLLGEARCGANAAECAPPESRLRYLRAYLRPAKASKSIAALLALAATTAVISQFATKSSHDLASNGSLAARGKSAAFDSSRSRGDGAMRGSVVAGVLSAGLFAGSALAQDAVQWRVEDGGNGHWYQWKPQGSYESWNAARDAAAAMGGYLASIRSESEENFARSIVGNWNCGYAAEQSTAIGGFQPHPEDLECCWEWVSGEPWTAWSPWTPGELTGVESVALMKRVIGWNDGEPVYGPYWSCRIAALFEWSADCNSDGIVDFGQIRAGELEDTNANNIPDCCEQGVACNCPADIDESGAVNAIDLAIVIGYWGTDGGKDYPQADIDGSGEIDGADLATLLGSWGPCE